MKSTVLIGREATGCRGWVHRGVLEACRGLLIDRLYRILSVLFIDLPHNPNLFFLLSVFFFFLFQLEECKEAEESDPGCW